ncbi:competence type IV pilus major pilin ComGC [Lacticigenium naphthae]|uniref:competence type IV pilus major pilin ComGC n=1 Tax=Lacticigenium naphthae TaxID=515351 RepID=UPI0003FEA452|nr:competence type IV pilus major pilin ComGC [Lacticigenium naphthae]
MKNKNFLKNNKGFTLVEMIIVLLVISSLLLLVIPNIGKYGEHSTSVSDEALQIVLQNQVELYKLDNKNISPTDFNSLTDDYLTSQQVEKAQESFVLINGKVTKKIE